MLAHLGALGRHVGPLGRHLVPLARHLIANMSENVPKSSKTAPKMPQTPLPSLPKVPKTKENRRFFNVFRFPTHLLKSSKNAPRTAPEAPKLSSKCPSCRYHAPSWHFHDPSWGHPARISRPSPLMTPTWAILGPSLDHHRPSCPPRGFPAGLDRPSSPRGAPRTPRTSKGQ